MGLKCRWWVEMGMLGVNGGRNEVFSYLPVHLLYVDVCGVVGV